jgi:protocatechuate 3,4-dioxygenase beta subunit
MQPCDGAERISEADMTLIATPALGRRRFLVGSLAAVGGLALPALSEAQTARIRTPAATAGPFYPPALPKDIDNDLVVVRGSQAKAEGTVTHIVGRILDLAGRPIADAQVEIWQCDAHGRYLHPGSEGRHPRDAAFQGFGRARSGPDGAYRFRTIRPVPYTGRTPHIHFAVKAGRTDFITQMYVAGEPLNARDLLYTQIADRRQRDAVTVRLDPADGIEPGALAGEFDIVLAT